MGRVVGAFYKVVTILPEKEPYRVGTTVRMSQTFNTWDAANDQADKMEKENPDAEVQLWVRER